MEKLGLLRQKLLKFYGNYIIDFRRVNYLTLLIGLCDLWWALVLLLPGNLFERAPSFWFLSQLVSDSFLGLICLFMGLSLLYFLFKNHKQNLRLMIIVNMVFWFFVCYSFLFSNIFTTGTGIYFLLGITCGVIYLRLKDNE